MTTENRIHQPLNGAGAARLLGLCATSSFNRTRRRLERYLVHHEGAEPQLVAVPAFASIVEYRRFAKDQILVVPEWGGRSVYGGDWTYMEEKCRAWARMTRGSDAEIGRGAA